MLKFICLIFLPMVLSLVYNIDGKNQNNINNNVKHNEQDTLTSYEFGKLEIHDIAGTNDSNTSNIHKLEDDYQCIREDYQHFKGIGSYKLHTRGASFFKARQICQEEGGHLAIINSLAEEKVLLDLFKRVKKFVNVVSNEKALLGIHDLFNEGDWETIFGQSLYKTGFSKWSDNGNGQPNDTTHKFNCGFLLKSGGLDDDLCTSQYPFFCEIPEYCVAYL